MVVCFLGVVHSQPALPVYDLRRAGLVFFSPRRVVVVHPRGQEACAIAKVLIVGVAEMDPSSANHSFELLAFTP